MNLVKNGTFDAPSFSGAFTHFTAPGTPPFLWAISWAASGTPTAELQRIGSDGPFCELASTAPYTISQVINPTPGEDYVFAFRAKARPGYPSPFLARLTKPTGVVVEYRIKPGPEWRTYTFCQCPTNGEVTVAFVGLGTNDGGAFIDDVRYIN